jgi:hypothetical protein
MLNSYSRSAYAENSHAVYIYIPLHGYSTKFFDMQSYYSNLCYYSK